MAAYAALVSLADTIQQATTLSFDPHLKPQIKSLNDNITFLQEFLEELNNSAAIKCLEPKIRDAAYEAEDIIETHISDTITIYYDDLQKVVEEVDSIKEEAMGISNRLGVAEEPQWGDELPPPPAPASGATKSRKNTMVGFDSDMSQIKDRLTRGQSHLQIIPIVGMGGIGKTTLAKTVYDDSLVSLHFDTRAWATVSQNHQVKRILLDLLGCIKNHGNLDGAYYENLDGEDYEKLGELLYQSLKGWRYLIVMDDMWNDEVWDELWRYFPDDNNGSRILVTTRQGNVADNVNPSGLHHDMHFLSKGEGWQLLHEKVFAEDCCPLELEKIGKKIAEKCGGLPLAISVIGGLLSNVAELDFWEHVLKHVSSYANTNDEQCSKILLLSYSHLPQHLKACFLYMGLFPEDHKIYAQKLIKLWAAEGFLKPIQYKTSEEVAEDYLKDLVDRNLVLISEMGSTGKIKSCNMHDLLRDLCVRMCQAEKFLHIIDERYLNDKPEEGLGSERRLVIHATKNSSGSGDLLKNIIQDLLRVRSFLFISRYSPFYPRMVDSISFRQLRIFGAHPYLQFKLFPEEILQMVHLRYLAIFIGSDIPSSITLLRNLQTMIVFRKRISTRPFHIPWEILEMPQLRHVHVDYGFLPDPNDGKELCHLETLSGLLDLKWSDNMVKRFPNLKKLKIRYSSEHGSAYSWTTFGLHDLVHFHEVETLSIYGPILWFPRINQQWITFPQTLKKLCLENLRIPSNDHMANIGLLPNLEVLKLRNCYFTNQIWVPIEGGFPRLRFLELRDINMEEWTADSAHFPSLEHLTIDNSGSLKEIPLGIGEIPTLKLIKLTKCSSSVVDSAKQIEEEQRKLGSYQLCIFIW